MGLNIKTRRISSSDAVEGLKKIFYDLQAPEPEGFHDRWNWMGAGFYLDILDSEIKRLEEYEAMYKGLCK